VRCDARRDGACPATARTGCCRDAGRHRCGLRRGARPDGACPATARTGCCRDAQRRRGGEPRAARRSPVPAQPRPAPERPDAQQGQVPERRGPQPARGPEPARARRPQGLPEPVRWAPVRWGQARDVPQPWGPGRARGRHFRRGTCRAACARPAARSSRTPSGRTHPSR
jgi:hypothetical protein